MNRISLLHSIGLGNRRYLVLSSSQTVGHNGRNLCFYYEDQMKRSSLLRTSNCFGVDASTSLYTNMFMRLWSRPIFTTSGRSVRLDGHLPSFWCQMLCKGPEWRCLLVIPSYNRIGWTERYADRSVVYYRTYFLLLLLWRRHPANFPSFPTIKFNPVGVCYATLDFKPMFFLKGSLSKYPVARHLLSSIRFRLSPLYTSLLGGKRFVCVLEPKGRSAKCLIFIPWPIDIVLYTRSLLFPSRRCRILSNSSSRPCVLSTTSLGLFTIASFHMQRTS